MQKKKENLLGKIVKKNYNNKLEGVLEHKQFSEHTKSLLLSMLYKIEGAYSDYEKVKRNVETKDEYIENIISIIDTKCKLIDVINPSSPRSAELGRRTFIINKRNKTIKCYPVERKILYAISKLSKKDLIVDENKYDILAKPISDLINIGNNINTVEPLRDFNGYSWTTISREIESIEYNIIYQNLRMLVGYQLLNDWIKSKSLKLDYLEILNNRLKDAYGEKNTNKIIQLISELAILLEIKFNEKQKNVLLKDSKEILEQLENIDNKKQFITHISEKKKQLNENIRRIDTMLNNPKILEQEFDLVNFTLPDDKKYTDIKLFEKQIIQEREKGLIKIERLNKLLLPSNFVNYKNELEEKAKILKALNTNDLEGRTRNSIIKLQKAFLECFVIRIRKAQTKSQVMQLVYEFRYYLSLAFDINYSICEVEELDEKINKSLTVLLDKTKEEGITGIFTNRTDIENKIFKEILKLKTIRLEDIYMMLTKDKEKIYLQLFDENESMQKIEICKIEDIQKKDLDIKFNRKIKVFY